MLIWWCRQNCILCQGSQVGALNPTITVFGDKAFKGIIEVKLNHKGGALTIGPVLIGREMDTRSTCTGWGPHEEAKARVSRRAKVCRHPDYGFPVCRNLQKLWEIHFQSVFPFPFPVCRNYEKYISAVEATSDCGSPSRHLNCLGQGSGPCLSPSWTGGKGTFSWNLDFVLLPMEGLSWNILGAPESAGAGQLAIKDNSHE